MVNVERLARAIHNASGDPGDHDGYREDCDHHAAEIAAEYIRLAAPVSLVDPLLDRFEGSVLDAEPPCRCGTDAARAEGQMAFVRLDLICPKHDR